MTDHKDALQSSDAVSLGMYLKAMIESRLEEYLQGVDGRRASCWESIRHFGISQPSGCDEVTSPLSHHEKVVGGGQSCREPCQKLKLHSEVNS